MCQSINKRLFLFIAIILSAGLFFSTEMVASAFDDSAAACIEQPEKCKKTDDTIQTNEENTQSGSMDIKFSDGLRMIAALLFVIGLLYLLLRFINKKSQSYQQSRIVQNLGGTGLGGNRSIQIVKAGQQLLILGVGEDIRLIKEVTDEQERAEILKQYEEQHQQSLEPVDFLSTMLKRWKAKKTVQQLEKSSPPFQTQLNELINDIKKDRQSAMDKLDTKESKSDG